MYERVQLRSQGKVTEKLDLTSSPRQNEFEGGKLNAL